MLDFSEELEDYINGHIDPEPEALRQLYRYTHRCCLYPRMCSGHYQGRLLKMLTAMVAPRRVLELGTFTGYSALAIAEGLPPQSVIDTVEIDDERRDELLRLFGQSPYADRIRLHIGDALQVLDGLDGPWDMVFIDANKRHYLQYLEAVLPKVPVGGFILADNTLWDMKVTDADAAAHADAQTRAIAAFNDAVAADLRLEKVILPVRDGLTIMRRVE